MKDLKHTKGPWTNGWGSGVSGPTCPSIEGPTVAGRGWKFIPISKGRETIAIIPQQEDGTLEANAKLIAAAPDLIAAALSALDWLGHNQDDYACGEGNIKEACLELILAIKKATE